MKTSTVLSILLATLAPLHAQTPNLMSYQGRITNASGELIGKSSAVNRNVQFRLYKVPVGGQALYAENQLVTISGGEFSVLIGNGSGVANSPGPSAPASIVKKLSDVINGGGYEELYLGITVDDGAATTTDVEVSPRQQMVSGAFSLRSKVSESVLPGSIEKSMLSESLIKEVGVVDSSRIVDASIASIDINNGAVTAAKLDTGTIGLWTPSGTSIYRDSSVGILTTDPVSPLDIKARPSTWPINNGIRVSPQNVHPSDNANLLLQVQPGGGNPFVSWDIAGVNGFSAGINNQGGGNFHINNRWSDFSNAVFTMTRDGRIGINSPNPERLLDVNGDSILRGNTIFQNISVHNAGIHAHGQGLYSSSGLTVGGGTTHYGDVDNRSRTYFGSHIQLTTSGDWNSHNYDQWQSLHFGGVGNETGVIRIENPWGAHNLTFHVRGSTWGGAGWRSFRYDGDNNIDFASDMRLKTDIVDAEPMLDRVMDVQFRRFRWKDTVAEMGEDAKSEFGVIAQELQGVFPELVSEDNDGSMSVGYGTFATIACKALQELKTETDAAAVTLTKEFAAVESRLQDQLEEKDQKIADLEARLSALEKALRGLK